jgi:ubiquinone/menaquinone biosynthesis C-methylase UbiE
MATADRQTRCGHAGKPSELNDRVRFELVSAAALPLPDASFDLALLLHVGMNVPDKSALFREARRVLRDGGTYRA